MFGNITIQRGLSASEYLTTYRHESVHRFLSPKLPLFRTARAKLGMRAYSNSQFLRYLEEAAAEGYATKSLKRGLQFPLEGGYDLTLRGVATEGAVYVGGVGLAAYWANRLATGGADPDEEAP
jgi:hypothetical protein